MSERPDTSPLTAIIIDDEASAINVLSKLFERIGNIKLLAAEQKPNIGLRQIMILKPDIIFLDVQMEKKDGIFLLKEIKELSVDSHIVIVSGYDDYTFEAFKNGACDYLIKPISVEELKSTISRIAKTIQDNSNKDRLSEKTNEESAKEGKYSRLEYGEPNNKHHISKDIFYLKASGSYTEVHKTNGQKELLSKGLWLMERELPNTFFRIHRSVIINTEFLDAILSDTQQCVISANNRQCTLNVSKANIDVLHGFLPQH